MTAFRARASIKEPRIAGRRSLPLVGGSLALNRRNVPGISADCGGNAACGTCRIYVPADWQDRFAAPGRNEQDMLDYIADATPGARLACQNKVSEAMAGMELSLPESQHY